MEENKIVVNDEVWDSDGFDIGDMKGVEGGITLDELAMQADVEEQ